MATEHNSPRERLAADEARIEFASEYAGRRATCEGGGQAGPGLGYGSRATYVGRLSGRRMVYGDPPWAFLELTDIIERPAGSTDERVWCDEANVFLED